MKGAWGMAKDQLTGDSADDKNYDPKLSPLQAFQNSSKLTANQSVDHLEWGICFGRRGGDGPCCFDCCWCPCCP